MGRKWTQTFDLAQGTWVQEHYANNVLIWKDTWDMDSTAYSPLSDAAHHNTMLLAHGESASAQSDSTDYTTTAIISASALGLSLFACVYHQ